MKRISLISGIIILIGIGWSSAWFYAANFIEKEFSRVQQKLQSQDQLLECDNQKSVGYPFRIGISCDRLNYENLRYGSQFSAKALRSAAQLYQPGKVVAEFTSPGSFNVRNQGQHDVQWASLFSSMKASLDGPERVSS